MLRPFFVLAILLALPLASAHATSRSRSSETKQSLAARSVSYSCSVRAKFLRSVSKRAKVYWQFSIESAEPRAEGECPSASETLDVLVLGAQYVPARSMFVYPEYIQEPAGDSKNLLQLSRSSIRDSLTKREYRDWTIADWENGIRALP